MKNSQKKVIEKWYILRLISVDDNWSSICTEFYILLNYIYKTIYIRLNFNELRLTRSDLGDLNPNPYDIWMFNILSSLPSLFPFSTSTFSLPPPFLMTNDTDLVTSHLSPSCCWSCCWRSLTDLVSVVKHEVVGVVGSSVSIPCNCTPSYSHIPDTPVLILWYKDKAKLPIYRSVPLLLLTSISFIIFSKKISSLHQKHSNISLKKLSNFKIFSRISWINRGILDVTC